MFAAPKEPGAYTQTITFNDGANKSQVSSGNVAFKKPIVSFCTKSLLGVNKLTAGAANGLTVTMFPELVYNQARCKLDLGLIIDGMLLDIQNDQNANFNSIKSGVIYFSTVPDN